MSNDLPIDGRMRRFGHGASRREVTKVTVGALLGAATLAQSGPRAAIAQDATPAAGSETCPTTTEAENLALVRRYIEEGLRPGGEAVLREVLADDEIHHWGVFDTTEGIDAFLDRFDRFLTAFPDDFAMHMEEGFAGDDMVAARYTATGTHSREPWMGIEAAGTAIEYTGMNLFHIACGKIAESWGEANHLSLLRQLGGLPEATPTP